MAATPQQQHDNQYPRTSSPRLGNDNDGKASDGAAGVSRAAAAIQDRRRSHDESPVSVATISATVSRGSRGVQRRYPFASHSAGARSGVGDPVHVTTSSTASATVDGNGGGGKDIERGAPAGRAPGGGCTGGYGRFGGAEERNGTTWHSSAPPTDSTRRGENGEGTWLDPAPAAGTDRGDGNATAGAQAGSAEVRPVNRTAMGEVGDRSAAPGDAGFRVLGGIPTTGFSVGGGRGDNAGQPGGDGGGGVEGESSAEVREDDVAKKLDFHTVFD